jgi:hypothetical protein
MNQDIGSIFQKGGGNPNPGTVVHEKKSKFIEPMTSGKQTTHGGNEAATESPVKKGGQGEGDDSSSSKHKPKRKTSGDGLIPGQDNTDSEKGAPAKKKVDGAIKIAIPDKKQQTLPL